MLVDEVRTAPVRAEDDWMSLVGSIAEAAVDVEGPGEWRADMAALAETESFGLRVALASHLRDMLAELERQAARLLPVVPVEELPVSKDDARGDGQRAIELCYLWRSRLTSPGDAAIARLHEFYADEQIALERWEQARAEARRPALLAIARVTEALAVLLELPLPAEHREYANPVLRAIFECVAGDCETLASEARERLRAAREELAAVPEAVLEAR
jgi:hypothetical protein